MKGFGMAATGDKDSQKSALGRLEERAINFLYLFVERDAGNWRFWVKITVTMFFVTAGPAILIGLFFLGRDLGYFE
jgi:hypothetical protein